MEQSGELRGDIAKNYTRVLNNAYQELKKSQTALSKDIDNAYEYRDLLQD